MKLTPEQIQAKLDSFNKAYKESGLTDGKIAKEAARQVAVRAGAYKKTKKHKKALKKQLHTPEVRDKIKKTHIEKYGCVGGNMHLPEVQIKRIKAQQASKKCQEAREKSLQAMLTPESKAKAKNTKIKKFGSATGYMNSPEIKAQWIQKRKKPVLQYDLQGNFIKEWPSAVDVMSELGIHKDKVYACVRGIIKSGGGFIWKYKLD